MGRTEEARTQTVGDRKVTTPVASARLQNCGVGPATRTICDSQGCLALDRLCRSDSAGASCGCRDRGNAPLAPILKESLCQSVQTCRPVTNSDDLQTILVQRATSAVPRIEGPIAGWRIQKSLAKPSRQWRNWIRRDGIESFSWIIMSNLWLMLFVVIGLLTMALSVFAHISKAFYLSLIAFAGVCLIISFAHWGRSMKIRLDFHDRKPSSSYEDVQLWLATLPPERREF